MQRAKAGQAWLSDEDQGKVSKPVRLSGGKPHTCETVVYVKHEESSSDTRSVMGRNAGYFVAQRAVTGRDIMTACGGGSRLQIKNVKMTGFHTSGTKTGLSLLMCTKNSSGVLHPLHEPIKAIADPTVHGIAIPCHGEVTFPVNGVVHNTKAPGKPEKIKLTRAQREAALATASNGWVDLTAIPEGVEVLTGDSNRELARVIMANAPDLMRAIRKLDKKRFTESGRKPGLVQYEKTKGSYLSLPDDSDVWDVITDESEEGGDAGGDDEKKGEDDVPEYMQDMKHMHSNGVLLPDEELVFTVVECSPGGVVGGIRDRGGVSVHVSFHLHLGLIVNS